MIYKITSKSKLKKMMLESIMPSVLSQLKIYKSRYSLQVFITSQLKESGLTPLEPVNGSIVVFLNKNLSITDLCISFCHEMVHVKQIVSGKLKPADNGKIWVGKFFHESTNYMQCPWEVQAYSKQEIIFRRSIE
jgi:hypothetical protein